MQPEEEPTIDLAGLSSFPFLSEASDYVRTKYSLDDLIESRAYESARERGKERVYQAMVSEIGEPNIGRSDEVNRVMELLSYPFARILVSCLDDDYLTRRYALSEAKLAHQRMLKMPTGFLLRIGKEFDLDATGANSYINIYFTDYLKLATGIRDSKWKLVNRVLDKGYVKLKKEEFSRLIQEAVREKIGQSLPMKLPSGMCTPLERYLVDIRSVLKEVKSKFEVEGFGEVRSECFPPCISYLIANMQKGINLPHTARFALTSFLVSIGMTVDEIVKLYANSPDFLEDKTRYQVNHIYGSDGDKYTPPACSTMQTYGNCFGKDNLCQKVSHPLSYYRAKSGSKGPVEDKKTSST
ncbi:MAG: DNA primase regulatory subunit PriL [Halobacteriota archaeon]|nr:DNA primase regulatory subunit PriL [Halobacteriota archaeon]